MRKRFANLRIPGFNKRNFAVKRRTDLAGGRVENGGGDRRGGDARAPPLALPRNALRAVIAALRLARVFRALRRR